MGTKPACRHKARWLYSRFPEISDSRDLRGRAFLPIFFARAFLSTPSSNARSATSASAGHSSGAIERTVTGLGYDLVDVERLGRGLLRVTIDRLPGQTYGAPGAPDDGEFITVEDCERVTRQLQLALEVAGLDYARLEVSSPGLDRPLKTEAHWRRFAGQAVSLTLKLPFENRKHWTGVLRLRDEPGASAESADRAEPADRAESANAWRLEITENKDTLALDFRFDEVREMRLVPVVDFKGRRKNPDVKNAAPTADAALNGEQDR